jgi:hypothetical protein
MTDTSLALPTLDARDLDTVTGGADLFQTLTKGAFDGAWNGAITGIQSGKSGGLWKGAAAGGLVGLANTAAELIFQ